MAKEKSPAFTACLEARDALERALTALEREVGTYDRAGVQDRALTAMEAVYAALDAEPLAEAHRDGIEVAASATHEARALLVGENAPAIDDPLARAEHALRKASERIAAHRWKRRDARALDEPPAAPRPFRASQGVPSLFALPRRPLVPDVALPAPAVPAPTHEAPSRPTSLAALAALASPGVSDLWVSFPNRLPAPPKHDPFEPGVPDLEVLRRLGRPLLEDIAGAYARLAPGPGEGFRARAAEEARVLAALDAFASLGGAVLPTVTLFVAEARVPDPGRAFAAALVLGCVEGHDAAATAVGLLRGRPVEEHAAIVEALARASSPDVDVALERLATNGDPSPTAAALDALARRGGPSSALLEHLGDHATPSVTWRVARALGHVGPRDVALRRLVALGASRGDRVLALAALEARLARGDRSALDPLRALADAGDDDALELVALAGDAGDAERLLRALEEAPTAMRARAVGRHGHVGGISALLALLTRGDETIAPVAAEALACMTGLEVVETVDLPWREDADDGTPRPTRATTRLATSPARWAEALARADDRVDARRAHRFGRPFTPRSLVAELAATGTNRSTRRLAARELAVRTGSRVILDGWVAAEEASLAALDATLAARAFPEGLFAFGAHRLDAPTATPRGGASLVVTDDLSVAPWADAAPLPFTRPTTQAAGAPSDVAAFLGAALAGEPPRSVTAATETLHGRRRLVRFDPATGAPLDAPYWEDLDEDA